MILYENGFIKLDYNPSTDVLYVKCPDIYEQELLFIHKAIRVVVEAVASHGIKNFVLDASRTEMDMSSENHGIVMAHFASDLVATGLQKLARIVSEDTAREKRVEAFVKAFYEEEKPTIGFRNFTSKAAAIDWITGRQASTAASPTG